ncbi:MAG: secretin and TonB N-terminal domain-containing protein [Pseudomonadota bacterium]
MTSARWHRPAVMRLTALAGCLTLAGCAVLGPELAEDFPRYHQPDTWPAELVQPIELGTAARLGYPEPATNPLTEAGESLYSFVINDLPIKDGLRQFALAYKLNLVVDGDVSGQLNVNFRDVPLDQALSLMLESLDYYYEETDGVIRVRSYAERLFNIDYLRLTRTGTGSSTASVSTASAAQGGGAMAGGGGGGAGGGAGAGQEAGRIVIGHDDEIKFWEELEQQVGTLLSETGNVVVNRLSGTLMVSDRYAQVRAVGNYLEQINRAIHRQVDIEVRILEVTLDDTTAFGVNWSRIADLLDTGTSFDFNVDGAVTTPAGGLALESNVLTLNGRDRRDDGSERIGVLIEALDRQGDVEIVSQPHVRTLNNQTSLIKVGTDRTFFRKEQTVDSTSAGSISTATDVPQVVTEGVVLSITPQIGQDGWIMMDISPVVTRVSSVSIVEGPGGVVQSSAPNLDVAQISSLVRARSGDTVVLGGLIQTRDSRTRRGLPGLRRAGPLNRLVGGRYDAVLRKELIMVLTPNLVGSGS